MFFLFFLGFLARKNRIRSGTESGVQPKGGGGQCTLDCTSLFFFLCFEWGIVVWVFVGVLVRLVR